MKIFPVDSVVVVVNVVVVVVDGVGVGELRAPVLMNTPGNEREEEGQVGLLRSFFSESWAIRSLRNLYLSRPTMA